MPVLRWFNRFLKGQTGAVETVAIKYHTRQELKVFEKIPEDQINKTIQESFVPKAQSLPSPQTAMDWAERQANWVAQLKMKSFAGWPDSECPLALKQVFSSQNDGMRIEAFLNSRARHMFPSLSIF